jgi:hypothetical protein
VSSTLNGGKTRRHDPSTALEAGGVEFVGDDGVRLRR